MTEARRSLLYRVVRWLRAGYPAGVPRADYVALLGVLHRDLTATEVDQIADELAAAAEEDGISEEQIRDLISARAHEQASESDVARVSARLAAGGWPLAPASIGGDDSGEELADDGPGLLSRIVAWLREGYPTGVPDSDYIPLLALLRRRLSDDEVAEVTAALAAEGVVPADRGAVGAKIAEVLDELPSESDMQRVLTRLHQHVLPPDVEAQRPDRG